MRRRTFLAALATAACGASQTKETCSPGALNTWPRKKYQGRWVYSCGSGPPVILLHELNGLSPGCIDFAAELAGAGFTVHMPLLFGQAPQDNAFLGYFQACWGSFSCGSTEAVAKPAEWVRGFIDAISPASGTAASISVIGMCLTGALPLETQLGAKVRAVVMSQPALPFGGGEKQKSVGVSDTWMQKAKQSGVPILGLRYVEDTICTCQRFKFLKLHFGDQFTCLEYQGPKHFHTTFTHRLHAVLTGAFDDEVKKEARAKVIQFLRDPASVKQATPGAACDCVAEKKSLEGRDLNHPAAKQSAQVQDAIRSARWTSL